MALLCTLGAVVMRSACSNAVSMYDAAHSRVGAVMMSAPRLDKPDFRYGTGRTFEERDLGHGYSVGFRSMKRIEPTRDASPPVTVLPPRTTPSDSRLPGFRGFVVRGFGVRGSWFVVRGSRFVVRGSWFVVRGLWFLVLGSWFLVRGSWVSCFLIGPTCVIAVS